MFIVHLFDLFSDLLLATDMTTDNIHVYFAICKRLKILNAFPLRDYKRHCLGLVVKTLRLEPHLNVFEYYV